MSKIKAVFAVGHDNVQDGFAFGYEQGLPWGHCKEDLQRFKEETAGSVLIMGAKTFNSLPGKLPGRVHCVLSASGQRITARNGSTADYIIHGGGLSNAIGVMQATHADRDICLIGGKGLLMEALRGNMVDEAVISRIVGHRSFNAPRFHRDVEFTVSEFFCALAGYELHDADPIFITHEKIDVINTERWVKK